MLVRHASHADTPLPVHLLRPPGRDLFVPKEELLPIPAGIWSVAAAERLRQPGRKGPSAQVAAVTSLIDGVSAKDAVCLPRGHAGDRAQARSCSRASRGSRRPR